MAKEEGSKNIGAFTNEENKLAQLATKLYKEKNTTAALKCITKLMELRPYDIKVRQNWLLLHNSQEIRKDFRKLFEKIAERGGEDPTAIFVNTIVLYFAAKKYQEAYDLSKRVDSIIPVLDASLDFVALFIQIECCFKLSYPEQIPNLIAKVEKALFSEFIRSTKNMLCHEAVGGAHVLDRVYYNTIVDQLRVRCLLALRSLKACKRQIKNSTTEAIEVAPNMWDMNRDAHLTFSKAHMEHLKDNEKKASKIMNAFKDKHNPEENSLGPVWFNNMACIKFKAGKYGLALFYSRKALRCYDRLVSTAKVHDVVLLHDVLYNHAICWMFCGNPTMALETFSKCTRLQSRNPLSWLRVAECTILFYQKSPQNRGEAPRFTHRNIGRGRYSKFFLSSSEISDDTETDFAFAMRAIRVCLTLLDDKMKFYGSSEVSTENPPFATQLRNLSQLKISAHCAAAYVALLMGDTMEVQEHCTELLNMNPGEVYYALAKLYQAEANIIQENTHEAVRSLNLKRDAKHSFGIHVPKESDTEIEWSLPPKMPWLPKTLCGEKRVYMYNLAVAHALQEDTRKAEKIVCSLLENTENQKLRNVVHLALYLHLFQGNFVDAGLIVSGDSQSDKIT